MRLLVFGLTLSSSWGNGHATLWRGLLRALARRGHSTVFFERDTSYYAEHRDLTSLPGAQLVLYPDWDAAQASARRHAAAADVAIVTSYCPDAAPATQLLRDTARIPRVFYDLDTPVTLAHLAAGESIPYLPPGGLADFDLVLSFTGGAALTALQTQLGATRVAALYGHVDPEAYYPATRDARFACDLSYLGTYAADRQPALEALFVAPARRRPSHRFVLGGAAYPQDFPWAPNIWFVRHVAPPEHPAFFSSSSLTLNVTRRDMAAMGHCPSGRLFEAAACGTAILSDEWEGLERFFTPAREILLARSVDDVTAALDLGPRELAAIGRAGRERALDEHTSAHRADELLALLQELRSPGIGRARAPAEA